MQTEIKLDEEANAILNEAIIFAVQSHKKQLRKGTMLPYILHPLEVMEILYLMSGNQELLAAGVLHDVVEDTPVKLEEIAERFGTRVAELVASHTDKHPELTWEERKEKALEETAQAGLPEQQLVLADKLANIRNMVRDYNKIGDELWSRFHQGREKQAWYYHKGVEILRGLAQDPASAPFYEEFKKLVYELYGEPEAHLNAEDLEENEQIICENEEKVVRLIVEQGALRLEGEEFGSPNSDSDNYEYSIELNKAATETLILELRKEFGQEISLKEIFKEKICSQGRYYGLLRYCEKKNIVYNMSSF